MLDNAHAPVTILIADDHPIVLNGLREIIARRQEYQVVAECHDGAEALEQIRCLHPRIAVLDIEMPQLSGLDVAAIVQRDLLNTRILILTITDSVEIFNRAMDYGVTGYVLKDAAVTDLKTGLREILAGRYYISPSLRGRMPDPDHTHSDVPQVSDTGIVLTKTERKVLRFIGEDRCSSEIAELLHVSKRTIDSHREHISRKLGLHGSYALLRYALLHHMEL